MVVFLAEKFEGALSLDLCNLLYKVVYADSDLVGLVGTASMSDFSVVYVCDLNPQLKAKTLVTFKQINLSETSKIFKKLFGQVL